ncbi:MAG: penicillin acylase family protein, partial [Anaerolineae bacterium]|nr:penicillin acylase family protein [Anaerolineae bacterium]
RTLPLGGDGFTVNQADTVPRFPPEPVHVIASCRMIIDVGEWDNSQSILPGGQSGHPASAHYQDHIDDWHHGRYHPMVFSQDAVERAASSHLTLLPPGGDRVKE